MLFGVEEGQLRPQESCIAGGNDLVRCKVQQADSARAFEVNVVPESPAR
jgi:hypothetical protein